MQGLHVFRPHRRETRGEARLTHVALRDVFARPELFPAVSGELYFRTGRLPWLGLLVRATRSAAMLYGASVNIVRKDF